MLKVLYKLIKKQYDISFETYINLFIYKSFILFNKKKQLTISYFLLFIILIFCFILIFFTNLNYIIYKIL